MDPVTPLSPVETGLQINNKYTYVVGMKITQNDSVVLPDFHLQHIEPRLVNYATAVVFNIQNSEAAIAKDMELTTRVYKKGETSPLVSSDRNHVEMAPNSNCDYVIDWNNKGLVPGTYRLYTKLVWQDKVWEWDEEFDIAPLEADSINTEAAGQLEAPRLPPHRIIILAILILLLLLFLAFRLGKRIERKQHNYADS